MIAVAKCCREDPKALFILEGKSPWMTSVTMRRAFNTSAYPLFTLSSVVSKISEESSLGFYLWTVPWARLLRTKRTKPIFSILYAWHHSLSLILSSHAQIFWLMRLVDLCCSLMSFPPFLFFSFVRTAALRDVVGRIRDYGVVLK